MPCTKQDKNGKRGERNRAWQKHGCSSGLGAASVDVPPLHAVLRVPASEPAKSAPANTGFAPATVLALPACAVIAPGLRALLSDCAPATEPALRDPLDVLATTLELLTLLGADGEVIAAAILHACPTWRGKVRARLDQAHPAVAVLLDGQAAAAQVWALHAAHRDDRNQEGLRRLLLAIVRDLRVIPILLSRQLARLRFATRLPEPERRALAQLTRDIHAPLANRLGIWQIKWELEDLAFRFLDPEQYRTIADLLDERRADRERRVAAMR
jgi:GTP pyrophosphokinase